MQPVASKTNGTLTVTAKNSYEADMIIHLLLGVTSAFKFNTTATELPVKISDTEARVGLTAQGCWTYRNNLTELGCLLDGCLLDPHSQADRDLKRLMRRAFTLTFDYTDQVIYHGVTAHEEISLTHKAGTPFADMQIGYLNHSLQPSEAGICDCRESLTLQYAE